MFSWTCPACNNALVFANKSWACKQRHQFDMAKEGYVNLLLAQHKNSKQPGDNKQMVNGRRAFLEQGYYTPLANRLAGLFSEYLQNRATEGDKQFFDAGCGEGFYLKHISQLTNQQDADIHYSGIDISKFAVQKAAKKYADFEFAVASTFNIPLPSEQQDVVLQIFAPSSDAEVLRVLKPQGIWITVNPAANHLAELKQLLYDHPNEHKTSLATPSGFELLSQEKLGFTFTLTEPQQRENLLMMTPFYWTATEDKKQRLLLALQNVTADFDICVFIKKP